MNVRQTCAECGAQVHALAPRGMLLFCSKACRDKFFTKRGWTIGKPKE